MCLPCCYLPLVNNILESYTNWTPNYIKKMSTNFAYFLLENANNGREILAVLDDIVEVESTVL